MWSGGEGGGVILVFLVLGAITLLFQPALIAGIIKWRLSSFIPASGRNAPATCFIRIWGLACVPIVAAPFTTFLLGTLLPHAGYSYPLHLWFWVHMFPGQVLVQAASGVPAGSLLLRPWVVTLIASVTSVLPTFAMFAVFKASFQ